MMSDLQEAQLEAVAEVQEMMREVMLEVAEQLLKPQAATMWAQMDANMREQFKQEQPEAFAALMKGLTNGE